MEEKKIAVLLVNLGTPKSCSFSDVKKYLTEFLMDPRVMDLPYIQRNLLVRGAIIPRRYKDSARQYQDLWTEKGSPLLVYGQETASLLQEEMGPAFEIHLAMRYQIPSIPEVLENICKSNPSQLIIFPLFPQYASATTGSVHQKVMECLQKWEMIPKLTFIDSYPAHPALIASIAAIGRKYQIDNYDHILFSFHGLPERQLKKCYSTCLTPGCCASKKQKLCYKSQCFETAEAIRNILGISLQSSTITFQSRLGKDPWITPYTNEVIEELAVQGKKKILVFSPAFVCDCLETIFEIGTEYAHLFKKLGGERLDLVEGLNCHPEWIRAIKLIILENI